MNMRKERNLKAVWFKYSIFKGICCFTGLRRYREGLIAVTNNIGRYEWCYIKTKCNLFPSKEWKLRFTHGYVGFDTTAMWPHLSAFYSVFLRVSQYDYLQSTLFIIVYYYVFTRYLNAVSLSSNLINLTASYCENVCYACIESN